MAKPARLANRTQWSLLDILAELAEARRSTKALQERNEQKIMDPLIAMHLHRLSDALGRIETTTIRAQHGEYGNGSVDRQTTEDT
jgi:hypothetical protein